MRDLLAGLYRHYTGLLVQVLGSAEHTETKEKLVIYITLGVKAGYKIRARPYEIFCENVEQNGKKVARFEYLGETIPENEQNKKRDTLGQLI